MVIPSKEYVFTSESVSEGHPDKLCDIISDALVDLYLSHDPHAKTAIETVVSKDIVVLVGELNTTAPIDAKAREAVVRNCIQDIGYKAKGFHYETVVIHDYLHTQSPDIAQGVDRADQLIGAGDQGMMIGYATNETKEYLPAPLYYSHRILEALAKDRKNNLLPGLGPDAKVQLSLRYEKSEDQEGPVGVDAVVLSHQHQEHLSTQDVRELVTPYVEAVLPKGWLPPEDRIYINPTGRFVIGGPVSDSGLTGRKIIVDTYGSAAAHGGGAFSGKDPTKVDRSGAYMARYLAKNIVAAGLAKRCTLQIAYAIGMVQPVSFYVKLSHAIPGIHEADVAHFIRNEVDLSPGGIINTLELRRPIYKKTASYGHFGRRSTVLESSPIASDSEQQNCFSEPLFPWEALTLVDKIQSYFSLSSKYSRRVK